jgi:integrase
MLFDASGQNLPLTSLTRVHGAAFRAYLVHPDRTFKGKTALNNWTAVQALMNVAEDVGLIPRNVWGGMTLEVTGSEKRTKHTNEELKQLFNTPLFFERGYPALNNVSPDDAYWCMLLGLWTGARIGEIAQLEMADVLVQNGLEVLSIHGRSGTIKTENSERVIPVPPELIRLGFIEWATSRREAGTVKLFETLHRVGAVTPAEIMSEWNREYRKNVGAATGPLNGFHRFRHTVRSALAALHVGRETADALTGHGATGSSGTKIYTHIDAGTIFDALGRLKFPLELPRIYQVPFNAASVAPKEARPS